MIQLGQCSHLSHHLLFGCFIGREFDPLDCILSPICLILNVIHNAKPTFSQTTFQLIVTAKPRQHSKKCIDIIGQGLEVWLELTLVLEWNHCGQEI